MTLTAEKIIDEIGLDDLEVRKGDTGEVFIATLSRTHNGQRLSVSKRIPTDATEDDLRRVRDELDAWWDNEQV